MYIVDTLEKNVISRRQIGRWRHDRQYVASKKYVRDFLRANALQGKMHAPAALT